MKLIEGAIAYPMLVIAVLSVFWFVAVINEETRTQERTATALSCTSNSSGECAVTLPTAHEYSDLARAVVTEASPATGNRTADSVLASNRRTITVSALPTSTAHEFNVDYYELSDDVPEAANFWLKTSTWFWAFALPLAALAGLYAASRGRDR